MYDTSKKKGTIAGAVALVIGTSIGSGILALPEKASPAGLFPSSISIVICWGFLLIEALVLVEINVALRRKKRVKEERERVRGLLLAIEVLAVVYGGWAGSAGSGDWGKIPATIPVMIFSLVYHDLAPVLCAYLGGDLSRIRTSVLLGSLVPLLALLVWDAVALGLSTEADHVVDPVELLMRVQWSGVSLMVEAFSLLAVGTSLIGTLLGFSEFFKEQFLNISWQSPPIQNILNKFYGQRKWWGRNKITFAAMAMAVTPSLFVSTAFPDACSAAIDIAGGYCMTMLYGVLPPAMAWAMLDRNSEDTETEGIFKCEAHAALVVGLFACGIVMEQILQDIPLLAR
ncbi:Tyrosine-specific transport protein 2 [Morella rubra]|uniref:Tyrosine-specific transport protein 2 n=1 Tax=Morella rubra TaxID=262757 RepID=A0A6A1UR15_9ROSI|nr:Tyrosine-specific transport protein 2 [Morella rubra]